MTKFYINHRSENAPNSLEFKTAQEASDYNWATRLQKNCRSSKDNINNVVEIEAIQGFINNAKLNLVNQLGLEQGLSTFNRDFLSNGQASETQLVRSIHNAIIYAVRFDALKTNAVRQMQTSEIERPLTDSVIKSMSRVGVNMPDSLVSDIVHSYREQKGVWNALSQESNRIKEDFGRKAQIEYVKNNLDPLYTNMQRFKEVKNDVVEWMKDTNPLLLLVAAPIAIPLLAVGGGTRVFFGRAGEMALDEFIDKCAKKIDGMKKTFSEIKYGVIHPLEVIGISINKFQAKHGNAQNSATPSISKSSGIKI